MTHIVSLEMLISTLPRFEAAEKFHNTLLLLIREKFGSIKLSSAKGHKKNELFATWISYHIYPI
jgi:hypothetical protein